MLLTCSDMIKEDEITDMYRRVVYMNIFEQGIEWIQEGKTEEAIVLLEDNVMEVDLDQRLDIAALFIQLGLHDKAEQILLQIKDNSEAKILLSDIYIDLDNDDEAIAILNEFEPEEEGYLAALVQLADLYQSQGLYEVAENKLLEAKNTNPTEIVIDFALGELAFSLAEYVKASNYYEKVLRKESQVADIDIKLRLAEAYAGSGEFEKAFEFYENSDTNDPEALFRYAYLAFRAERFDIAIDSFKALLEKDEDYPAVYLYLAEALYEEGQKDEAYKIAKKGVEIDPFSKELQLELGRLAHQFREDELAEASIKKALELDPDYKEAILFLIEVFKQKNDYTAIIDHLTLSTELDDQDGLLKWELAKAYSEEEYYEKALKSYEEAYNNLKEDADYLKDYGYFLMEEGKVKEAIVILDSYLKIDPSDVEMEEYLNRVKEQ
ncbi:tetratricopeptide repeat protein [Saliterribacillus persicus]|uniref:Tfp pilus assembly protein PilF n=1 Tax=Saliterribacillus persicus TaxID=930114 RepID=A0A368XAC9_9BACI|nr:tetratricopeptide repeat protein [Saliterribacillus persicus]RCW64921.1 Tfp pilus assembly protein PilF [Saliterribacillus persicus]